MSQLSLSVFFRRILILLALFSGLAVSAQRQKKVYKPRTGSSIIDDSTKIVYGPATTRWTTEAELFENRPNYRPLDTTLNGYQRWTYVQRTSNFYKDLGPVGTALSPLFPQVPVAIGAYSGFETFAPYFDSEEPHYFDTKSPYTQMKVVWGGNGRAMTRVEFSRNINPRWNFGFNYRPMLVEKQIQRRQKGDYQTVSHYYDFYTTYRSKDSSYFLLFNYRRIRHRVKENGGVNNTGQGFENLFTENITPNLTSVENEDYRRNVHLFQQYQIVPAFQIYHIADFTRQTNSFKDVATNDPDSLFLTTYRYSAIDSLNPSASIDFNSMQQQFGIKGLASKFFYTAYFKFRTYSYLNPLLDRDLNVATSGTEAYVGGTMSLKIDSVSEFKGSAEYLLSSFYRIEGKINTPWVEGSFRNSLSKPGLMQVNYTGIHDRWNNDFKGVNSTEAKGYLKWGSKNFQLWAGGTFTLFNNYIFFKEDPQSTNKIIATATPFQSSGVQSTLSPEFKANVRFFKNIYVRSLFIYTEMVANDDNALQIPKQFVNIQLTYENSFFKDHLQLQTGIDFHWQSAYYGLAYAPTIQQFFVQDENSKVISPDFPLTDIFFTGKMRRARFFVKYHNLVQTFTGIGYLPTRGYPGQGSIIDFGFDFLLFD